MAFPTPNSSLPVWTFRPNFADDVTETLEWKTQVLTGDVGAEQRRAMRLYPRRSFEFSVLADRRERAYLDMMLREFGLSDWMAPVWTDYGILQDAVAPGAVSMQLDYTPFDLASNCMVLVMGAKAMTFETLTLTNGTIEDNQLAFTTPTLFGWPVGTRVYRLYRAQLTEQPTLSRYSSAVATSQAKLVFREPSPFGSLDLTTLPQFQSLPVLLDAPDYADQTDYVYSQIGANFDSDTGLQDWFQTGSQGYVSQTFNWTLRGRADHQAFRSKLYALSGKLTGFMMPSGTDDFEIVSDVAANTATLTVKPSGLPYVGVSDGRRYVCIQFRNPSTPALFAEITGAKAGAGFDTLTLGNNLSGVAIPAVSIRRISWLEPMRFDTDAIEITHKSDETGVSTVSAPIKSFANTRALGYEPGVAYTWWRVRFTGADNEAIYYEIRTLQWLDQSGNAVVTQSPFSNQNDNLGPSPLAVRDGAQFLYSSSGATVGLSEIFGDLGNPYYPGWQSNEFPAGSPPSTEFVCERFLTSDMTPGPINLTGVEIYGANPGQAPTHDFTRVTSFVLETSSDGEVWYVVQAFETTSPWGAYEQRTFKIASNPAQTEITG